MSRTITQARWHAEAAERFGDDPMAWALVCPACGHIQTLQDYKDAGAPSAAVAFSCVGRWIEGSRDAFAEGPGPCNYAGGGLFGLNPVQVILPGGGSASAFEWAPAAVGAT